jgi:hypothetical protein
MATRNWVVIILAAAAALRLDAQQGSVSGPVSGFVFDRPARALRPILGTPGASLIGDPLNVGFPLQSASVAPRQDFAVAVAADGSLHLLRLGAGSAAELTVNGVAGVAERVIFSPSGTAVLLYAAGRAQVVTGLPDAPSLSATVEILDASLTGSETLPQSRDRQGAVVNRGRGRDTREPSALAVSDDGTQLLVATRGAVRVMGAAGGSHVLASTKRAALVAFAPGGYDAAVVDAAGSGVTLFRDVTGAAIGQPVAPADNAIASAAGLAFSGDGRKLFLASSTAQMVTMFDLASSARSSVPCRCAPAGLIPMGGLFRLTEMGSGPLWLLDTGAAEPRIVFIPAPVPLN